MKEERPVVGRSSFAAAGNEYGTEKNLKRLGPIMEIARRKAEEGPERRRLTANLAAEYPLGGLGALREVSATLGLTADLDASLYVLLQQLDRFFLFPHASAIRL